MLLLFNSLLKHAHRSNLFYRESFKEVGKNLSGFKFWYWVCPRYMNSVLESKFLNTMLLKKKKSHHLLLSTQKMGVMSVGRSTSPVKVKSKKPEKVMSPPSVVQRKRQLLVWVYLFVFTRWRMKLKPPSSAVLCQICSTRICHNACVIREMKCRKKMPRDMERKK